MKATIRKGAGDMLALQSSRLTPSPSGYPLHNNWVGKSPVKLVKRMPQDGFCLCLIDERI